MAKGDIGEPINVVNPGGHSYNVKAASTGSTKNIAAESAAIKKSRPKPVQVNKKTGKTDFKAPKQSKFYDKVAASDKGQRLQKRTERTKTPDSKSNFKGATKRPKNPYRG